MDLWHYFVHRGLDLLRPVVQGLPRATLHVLDGADHSFRVPKKSGRGSGDAIAELARVLAQWIAKLT